MGTTELGTLPGIQVCGIRIGVTARIRMKYQSLCTSNLVEVKKKERNRIRAKKRLGRVSAKSIPLSRNRAQGSENLRLGRTAYLDLPAGLSIFIRTIIVNAQILISVAANTQPTVCNQRDLPARRVQIS